MEEYIREASKTILGKMEESKTIHEQLTIAVAYASVGMVAVKEMLDESLVTDIVEKTMQYFKSIDVED